MTRGRRRWDDALEDRLEQVLAALRQRRARRDAVKFLSGKEYLRGRRCHCPDGLAEHFVHSEGLREAADVVVDFGSNVSCPGRRQLPVAALARIAPEIGGGDVVHVKTDLLEAFCEIVLPRLGGPVVLVTGDSDMSPVRRFRMLLDHPLVLHWFAQNCDLPGRHPRLTRIPIGLDNPRYAKFEKRLGFLLAMAAGKGPLDPGFSRNDMGEQDVLLAIRGAAQPTPAGRPARALCTFHVNQKFRPNFADIPDRAEAYRLLKDNPACHFPARRLSQTECWRLHREFAFEVSPRGKGLDCFRTWEALALGVIPIVRRSTLDPLYEDEGFPVVIVESFAEISPVSLRGWLAGLADRFTPQLTRKLSNAYWSDRIRRESMTR